MDILQLAKILKKAYDKHGNVEVLFQQKEVCGLDKPIIGYKNIKQILVEEIGSDTDWGEFLIIR